MSTSKVINLCSKPQSHGGRNDTQRPYSPRIDIFMTTCLIFGRHLQWKVAVDSWSHNMAATTESLSFHHLPRITKLSLPIVTSLGVGKPRDRRIEVLHYLSLVAGCIRPSPKTRCWLSPTNYGSTHVQSFRTCPKVQRTLTI